MTSWKVVTRARSVLVAAVFLASVQGVSTAAPRPDPQSRTIRATYHGFNDARVGPASVGLDPFCPQAPHDGCLRIKVRSGERAAEVHVVDASGNAVPFTAYDDVDRDGTIGAREEITGCGIARFPVGGGTRLSIGVQAGVYVRTDEYGVPTDACANPGGDGTIVATLFE